MFDPADQLGLLAFDLDQSGQFQKEISLKDCYLHTWKLSPGSFDHRGSFFGSGKLKTCALCGGIIANGTVVRQCSPEKSISDTPRVAFEKRAPPPIPNTGAFSSKWPRRGKGWPSRRRLLGHFRKPTPRQVLRPTGATNGAPRWHPPQPPVEVTSAWRSWHGQPQPRLHALPRLSCGDPRPF
jgi:hypothetical protein